MTEPLPVTIHRPRRSTSDLVGTALGSATKPFLRAWLVMLLLPIVVDVHLSYLHALAAVVLIRLVMPENPPLLDAWSKPTRKPKP